MDSLNQIEIINDLLRINTDCILIYSKCIAAPIDYDLKFLFIALIKDKAGNVERLHDEIVKIGGVPGEYSVLYGKIYKQWNATKIAGIEGNRGKMLTRTEFQELTVKRFYENALNMEVLTGPQRMTLRIQCGEIVEALDQIHNYKHPSKVAPEDSKGY